jgi:hypothetical protein
MRSDELCMEESSNPHELRAPVLGGAQRAIVERSGGPVRLTALKEDQGAGQVGIGNRRMGESTGRVCKRQRFSDESVGSVEIAAPCLDKPQ